MYTGSGSSRKKPQNLVANQNHAEKGIKSDEMKSILHLLETTKYMKISCMQTMTMTLSECIPLLSITVTGAACSTENSIGDKNVSG